MSIEGNKKKTKKIVFLRFLMCQFFSFNRFLLLCFLFAVVSSCHALFLDFFLFSAYVWILPYSSLANEHGSIFMFYACLPACRPVLHIVISILPLLLSFVVCFNSFAILCCLIHKVANDIIFAVTMTKLVMVFHFAFLSFCFFIFYFL